MENEKKWSFFKKPVTIFSLVDNANVLMSTKKKHDYFVC